MCSIRSLSLLLLTAVAGCGSGAEMRPTLEKVVPVSGTVTFQGKPLEYHQVSFIPTDGRRAAVGTTDASGKFTLGTNGVGDGAPPGKHKVTITFAPPLTNDGASGSPIDDPSLLPKPKVVIPSKLGDPAKTDLVQEVPPGGLSDLKIELN